MAVANKAHIPGAQGPLLGLRIAQLVLAIIILGLSAYGVYWLVYDGDALTLSSAVLSIVICIYVIVAMTVAPVIYNYWAVLGLDIVAVILWIVSFPILASQIANTVTYDETYTCGYEYAGYCYYKSKRALGVEKRATTTWETYKNVMIATAAFAGVEFVLFVISLVIHAVNLHRHRNTGGHSTPDSAVARHDGMVTEPKRNHDHSVAPVEPSQPEVYYPPHTIHN